MNSKLFVTYMMRLYILIIIALMTMIFLYSPLIMHVWKGKPCLTILAWPHMLDGSNVGAFEREYGVTVKIRYVESNEELFTKLNTAKDMSSYDLIMPTDYIVPQLIENNILATIDKTKLNFFSALDSSLLGHYYDPENRYSIPFYWGIYGLGVNSQLVTIDDKDVSWHLLFDESYAPYGIGLSDDPKILLSIAIQYAYGRVTSVTHDMISPLFTLLWKQKKIVTAYTDLRPEYLLTSGTCGIVLLLSTDATRIIKWYPSIQFYVPREGSFVSIDSFAIPANSANKEIAYQFLNYLYSEPVLRHYSEKFSFASPLNISNTHSTDDPVGTKVKKKFSNAEFLKIPFSNDLLQRLFVELKSY